MASFIRLIALLGFAAAGVAIAIFLASSLPVSSEQPQEPSAAPAWAANAGSTEPLAVPVVSLPTEAEVVPAPLVADAPVATPMKPVEVEPREEFAQQIPADPSILGQAVPGLPSGQEGQDALNQLGELGKSLLQQMQSQQPASPPATTRKQAAVPPAPVYDEGEEDEEGSGQPPLPPQGPMGPSSFKVTKLPGEGDDHLSVHIQNKDLREVLDFLGEHGGLSILCSNNVQGAVSVSLNNVSLEDALAAILRSSGFDWRRDGKFVYVGTTQDIQRMAQSSDRIGTRVYRPNYVKAADLQQLIMPLLTPAGSAGVTQNAAVAVSPPTQIGIAADNNTAGGDSFAQNEVLLVRDYEAVLAEVDQLVVEIDKRPLQVQIEAMLLSVEIKDTNSFGVDFAFLRDNHHLGLVTGAPLADIGQVAVGNGGLKLGFLDSSFGAFMSALQTIGDVNVIATPRLMCLNKHKAEILIGGQLGYVTKTLTQTTTTQAVEFLEIGTQLRLRPFISSDGLIRMEVHPEISTGNVEVKEGFTLPNKQTTQVTTNIMVRDGCTVIIGGLMQENLAQTGSQVPFLGSMPGIGFLFRNRTGTQNRSEIIVLVTPHIVYEPEACIEGEQAACDFHRQHAVYKDEMTPLNSRYIGRKFFRLAQEAWANGDKRAAMRFVNLAVHFDPQSRAAVELRSDIVADNHFGRHSRGGALLLNSPTEVLDGEQIAPWVLDDLEGIAPDPMPHPRDRGVTGRVLSIEPVGTFR